MKKNGLRSNIFTESAVCELGVTFMESGRKFSYDIKYDTEKEEYIYESFSEIFKDQYNNEKEVCWLKKDIINMNNIPMQHTIELMKNKNQLQKKVVEKSCRVYKICGFVYG